MSDIEKKPVKAGSVLDQALTGILYVIYQRNRKDYVK